jgi:GTPase SAR1 family protein
MSLRERAAAAFDAALAEVRGYPGLRQAGAAIAASRERFAATMSIALVGRVSSGKSTLANALLAGPYAATGISELTCNVTSLRYGPRPELTVHFTGDRPAETRDRAELLALSALARDDPALRDYLAAIDHLEVRDPNPRLQAFDLVDTPGLDAAHGSEHVRKTLEFLGRPPGSLRAATVSFASRADALVLVFNHTPAATDAEVVGEFVRAGLGAANPITAVGALTKTEFYWPEHDPIAKGRLDAERLMRVPAARGLLFEITPVAGKLAAAAGVLTEEDYADLESLARVPCVTLTKRLRYGPGFRTEPYPDLPVPAVRRDELFERFSGYGIALACALIGGTDATNPADLRELLAEHSGLTALRRLLLDHFGHRADIIKLRRVIDDVAALAGRLAAGTDPRELGRLRRAAAEITRLGQEPAFRELAMLRHCWAGELTFTAEEGEELHRVAGERGAGLADQLGLPAGAPLPGLAAAAAARHEYWADAVLDPRYAGASHAAAVVMLNAYDRIISQIKAARRAAKGTPVKGTPVKGTTVKGTTVKGTTAHA